MNSFLDLAKTRYSVRKYASDPIAPEDLGQILEAARLAPTAVNKQPFRLIVLDTEGCEDDLRRIYDKDWFAAQPPLVIAVCLIRSETWVRKKDGKDYGDVDAAIVMDHIVMAAEACGLGTCWVAAFDPDAAKKILGLPDGVEPIAFTPVGHPTTFKSPVKKRKALSELVMYNGWRKDESTNS